MRPVEQCLLIWTGSRRPESSTRRSAGQIRESDPLKTLLLRGSDPLVSRVRIGSLGEIPAIHLTVGGSQGPSSASSGWARGAWATDYERGQSVGGTHRCTGVTALLS